MKFKLSTEVKDGLISEVSCKWSEVKINKGKNYDKN